MKTKFRLLAAFVSLLFIVQNVGPSLAMASENETSEEPSFVLVNDETGESIELTQSELETLLSESTDVIDQQENTDTVDSSLESSTDESVIEPSEEDNIPSEMSETTTTITEEPVETTESVETTDPSETEPEGWLNLTYAVSQDDFIEKISDISTSNRLIIITDDNIDNAFEIKNGVYFEGAYIVSLNSQEDVDNAVNFLNENDIEYSVDGTVSVCSEDIINYSSLALKNTSNARIAVIDTGSNFADEQYSVINGDGTDENGHGTSMCNIVKESGAYVISIQALKANGKGQIVDVYNAIQLAETLNVDYILMSFSARDLGNFDSFKEIIANSNSTIIASAGNNDKNAALYVPANIDNVITIGALKEDLSKLDISNFGDCVDYWVVASSTSEAAAKYLQYVITGESDRIYTSYTPDEVSPTPEVTPEPTPEVTPTPSIVDDIKYPYTEGSYTINLETIDGQQVLVITPIDAFTINAYGTRVISDFTISANLLHNGMTTGTFWEKGTGNMSGSSKGQGTLSSMSASEGTASRPFNLSNIASSIAVECAAHYGDSYVGGQTSAQQNANSSSQDNGPVNYIAKYTISKNSSTQAYTLTVNVWASNRTAKGNATDGYYFEDPSWVDKSSTSMYRIIITCTTFSPGNGVPTRYTNKKALLQQYKNGAWSTVKDLGRVGPEGDQNEPTLAQIREKVSSVSSEVESYILGNGYSGKRFTSVTVGNPAFDGTQFSSVITVNYKEASGTQTYFNKGTVSKTINLSGDMIQIVYSTKNNTNVSSGKSYSLVKYTEKIVNGQSQPNQATSSVYAATYDTSKKAFVFTRSGGFDLGWYRVTVNGGALYIYLFDNGTDEAWKVVYFAPNDDFSQRVELHGGQKTPYTYTYTDVKTATVSEALPTNIDNTHSITLDGKTLTNTAFCIEPTKQYTKKPAEGNNWNNYFSTSTSYPASYAKLKELLTPYSSGDPMSRITGSTNTEKVINFCKILYAPSSTISNTAKQNYIWYVLGKQTTGNITTIPTYSPETTVSSTKLPFPYTVTYNNNTVQDGVSTYVPNGTTSVVFNFNSTDFNATNYQVTISGLSSANQNKVKATITSGKLTITIDKNIGNDVLSKVTIKITNKTTFRLGADGKKATAKDYYAFSIGNLNTTTEQKRFTAYYASKMTQYDTQFTISLNNAKELNTVVTGDTFLFTSPDPDVQAKHFCIEPEQNYNKPPEQQTSPATWSVWTKKAGNIDNIPWGNFFYNDNIDTVELCKYLMATLPTSVSKANAQISDIDAQYYVWKLVSPFGLTIGGQPIVMPMNLPNIPTYTPTYVKKSYSVSPYSFFVYTGSGALDTTTQRQGALSYANASKYAIKPGATVTFICSNSNFKTANFDLNAYNGDVAYAKSTSNGVTTFKRADGSVLLTVTNVGKSVGNGYQMVFSKDITATELNNLNFTISSKSSVKLNATGGTTLTEVEDYGVAIYRSNSYQDRIAAYYVKTADYYTISLSFAFKSTNKTTAEATTGDPFTFTGPNPDITIEHMCIQQGETYVKPPVNNNTNAWSVFTSSSYTDAQIKSQLQSKAGINLTGLTYTGTNGGTYTFSVEQFCKTYMTLLPKADTGANVNRSATAMQTWVWNLVSGKTNILPTATTYTTDWTKKGTMTTFPYKVTVKEGSTSLGQFTSGSNVSIKPNTTYTFTFTPSDSGQTGARAYKNEYFNIAVTYTGSTLTKTTSGTTDTYKLGSTTICTVSRTASANNFTVTFGNLNATQMKKVKLSLVSDDTKIKFRSSGTIPPQINKEYGIAIYENANYQNRIAAYYKETADYYDAKYNLAFEYKGKAVSDVGNYTINLSDYSTYSSVVDENLKTFCAQQDEVYPGTASSDTWAVYLGNDTIKSYLKSRVGIDLDAYGISVETFCKQLYSANKAATNVDRTDATGFNNIQYFIWYLQGNRSTTPIETVPKFAVTTINKGEGNVTFKINGLTNGSLPLLPGETKELTVSPYTFQGTNSITRTINLTSDNYEVVVTNANGHITATISDTNKITVTASGATTADDIKNAVVTIRSKSGALLGINGEEATTTAYYGVGINVNSAKQNRVAAYYYETRNIYSMSQEFRLGTSIELQLYKEISTTNLNGLVSGNSCYSFVGTKYTLYSDANCTQPIKTFTYRSNHLFNSTYINTTFPNTLYLKETAVGKGYDFDETVHVIQILEDYRVYLDNTLITPTADGLYTLHLKDVPGDDPIKLDIIKRNQNTTNNERITGAKFRIAFYAEDITWSSNGVPDLNNYTPTTVYEFSQDVNPLVVDQDFLLGLLPIDGSNITYVYDAIQAIRVSGETDTRKLPYGLYLIYESEAPDGFIRCNGGLIIKNIKRNGVSSQTRLTVNVDENGQLIGSTHGTDTFNETGAFTYTTDADNKLSILYVSEVPEYGRLKVIKSLSNPSAELFGEDIEGKFEFSVYRGTTLIAEGTTLADGTVYWEYKAHIRMTPRDGSSTGSALDLYGTKTTLLDYLECDTYQIREKVPTCNYGGTDIPYEFATPDGWTKSADGTYFYKDVTITQVDPESDEAVVQSVTNVINFGSIEVRKTAPIGDEFDLSKVNFELDRVDGNTLIRIADGEVDSNGNIEWTKVEETGIGTTQQVSINTVGQLPCGNYVVRELWEKTYIEGLDGKLVQIIESNNSGWTLVQNDTHYIYEKQAVIPVAEGSNLNLGNVENKTHGGLFGATKTLEAPENTTLNFELWYLGDTEEVYMASGTLVVNGETGTKNIEWSFNGTIVEQNNLQYLRLPIGHYELREEIPSTEIYGIPYTYKTPEGFTKGDVYFYKRFDIEDNGNNTITLDVKNERVNATLTINKVEDANLPTCDFTFDVYYRGQGVQAINVGDYSAQYLVTSVTITTTNGTGSTTLSNLPEGWYEIKEREGANWNESWTGDVTTYGTKLVHADSENQTVANIQIPAITAENKLLVTITVNKKDAWTNEVIVTPGTSQKVQISVYKDVNENGVYDETVDTLVKALETVGEQLTFEDLGLGKYILRETATVDGFYMSAEDIAFEIGADTETNFTMKNIPYGAPVSVTKIDADTNEPLSGASFAVYVDTNNDGKFDTNDTLAKVWVDTNNDGKITDDEIVDCVMTENNGVYTSNGLLHWNDGQTFGNQYLLVEVQAPDNYFFVGEDNKPTDKQTVNVFTVEAEDTTAQNFTVAPITMTIKNMTGSVEIVKRTEDGNYLANCTFNIYRDAECTQLVGVMQEVASEKLYRYVGLGLGTYYVKEVASPSGYPVDYNTYMFQITTANRNVVVDNKSWPSISGENGIFINPTVITQTRLIDVTTGTQSGKNGSINVVDHIYYKGLQPGATYYVTATLYDKATGTQAAAWNAPNSEVIPAIEMEFKPETSTGIFDFPFVASADTENRTFVMGIVIKDANGKVIGDHTNLNDTLEMVHYGSIKTTLIDADTASKQVTLGSKVILIDTVNYTNLVPGVEYKLVGKLVDKNTGNVINYTSDDYVLFTPTSANDSTEFRFEINSAELEGKTLVAFETLMISDTVITTHEDIDDVDQTVYVPKIRTTFKDVNSGEHFAEYSENAQLVDTVTYDNLIVGAEYTLTGTIMCKGTKTPLLGKDNQPITATQTFTAETSSGTVDIVFTIDTTALAESNLVAFEELTYKAKIVAEHKDIEDKGQTVKIVKIRTTLTSEDTADHVAPIAETIKLIDTVTYENLIIDKEYTVTGVLMDKETKKPILDAEGKEITGSTTFKAEAENGTVAIEFTLSSELLRGKTIVAFETLKYLDRTIAVHADINDVEQTVEFPNIHTTLISVDTDDHVVPVEENITLVDTVTFENLIIGKTYVMNGTLMDKETGKELLVDGKPVTAETTFTPTTKNGTVDVVFTFPTVALEDKTLVAFEELYYNHILVVTHNDINDVDQTVQIPKIKTTFYDRDVELPNTAHVDKKVTLVDKVYFENLVVGKTYTIYGTVMVKETNKPLLNADGEPVIAKTEMVAETTDGVVEVEFVVDTSTLQGQTLVAFETIEYNNVTLVIHADINDEDQTVRIPEVHTTALDKTDNDNVLDGSSDKQTIVDTVTYKNLIVGNKYKVVGKLVVKDTGDYVTDAKGNVITSEVEFTAETTDGTVKVEFTFDARKYAGEKVVVFEDLYYNNTLLVTHADINDEAQTVEIALLLKVKIAKADKDNIAYYLKDAEITIFNDDGTVALDVNGNKCVDMTNENGEVEFTVKYDKNNRMYAMETKAPAGYQLCTDKFYLTGENGELSAEIKIQILDAIIIIPPKTGDNFNIKLVAGTAAISGLMSIALFLNLRKKKKIGENS